MPRTDGLLKLTDGLNPSFQVSAMDIHSRVLTETSRQTRQPVRRDGMAKSPPEATCRMFLRALAAVDDVVLLAAMVRQSGATRRGVEILRHHDPCESAPSSTHTASKRGRT
jgi:hypothetical protein